MTSRTILVMCCAIVGGALQAQGASTPPNSEILKAFPDLKALTAPNSGVTVFYAPSLTKVLTGKDATIKIWGGEETADRPIRTQLLGARKGYFTVQCDPGPSGDSSCQFLQELPSGETKEVPIKLVNSENKSDALFGVRFILPGNGLVYVDGHMDTNFNERHKLEWKGGELVEVAQPFLYVGLESTTLKSVVLYSEADFRVPVAQLPVGSAVTFLLNVAGSERYLLKTPFGLVGWARIPQPLQEADVIKGLYWAGD